MLGGVGANRRIDVLYVDPFFRCTHSASQKDSQIPRVVVGDVKTRTQISHNLTRFPRHGKNMGGCRQPISKKDIA